MTILPLSQALAANCFKNVQLVATDMDGTLTRQGKFSSALLKALEDLAKTSIQVLVVTGRSAGWMGGVVSYLPIVGAIAENGGLFYSSESGEPEIIGSMPNLMDHRQRLSSVFQQLQSEFPRLQESIDNRFRITDWTFNNCDLSLADLQAIETRCQTLGWSFTYSTVQGHIKLSEQNKAVGLGKVLSDRFPTLTPDQIITVGDSPNDESLFNPKHFPLSVGVANVLDYVNQLTYQPGYVTTAAEGEGFCELVQSLMVSKELKGVKEGWAV